MEEHHARMVEHHGISVDNQRLSVELEEADAVLREMDETRQILLQEQAVVAAQHLASTKRKRHPKLK